MSRFTGWFRNEPIEPHQINSQRPQPRTQPVPSSRPAYEPPERDFSIVANLGGFTGVGIPWGGTSLEDARQSFLEFLTNDEEFGLPNHPRFRSLMVDFYGQTKLLTFRPNWVSGFTVGE